MPSLAVVCPVSEANGVSAMGQVLRSPGPGSHGLARLALKLISSKRRAKSKIIIRESPVIESAVRTERLTFHPQLVESAATAYDPQTRTAEVIVIEVGRGNARDKHYYGADTITQAARDKVFEGSQAYADHPSLDEDINRPERSVRDLFGYYFNTRVTEVRKPDGTRVPALAASLKIQAGADWAIGLIQEAIDYNKRFPDKTYVGISINADGDVSPAVVDNEQVNYVHRITEAFSADMVTKPARGGKFLALVESQHGSHKQHKKEDAVDKKLIESAAKLKAQIESGQIDKDDLTAHLQLIEAENTVPKSLGEAEKAFMESLSEADKEEFGKLDEAGKPPWLSAKMKQAATKEATKEAAADDPDDDGDNDADHDAAVMAMGKAAMAVGKSKAQESARDPKVSHPAIFAAALKEAQASVKGDVTALQAQVAELTARNTMRESIDLAKRKLTESTLPTAAATVLLEQLVGKPESEMDRLIEAQAAYLALLGVNKTNKQTAGAGAKSLTLRESESKANESFIFAGMGGN